MNAGICVAGTRGGPKNDSSFKMMFARKPDSE
jgi:hypothetical protein